MTEEKYVDHEVRIRIQEKNSIDLKDSIKHIDNKFNWMIGLIISGIIIPIILHKYNLI